MMAKARDYFSLVKFSHTIFAMPFALVGFFLGYKFSYDYVTQDNLNKTIGWGWSRMSFIQQNNSSGLIYKLLLVIACMILARTAAMSFNRYLDRDVDALNARTLKREIPAGIIKPSWALGLTVVCSLLFVVVCYFINFSCFLLAPVALFVILGYSYTKRFTALSHLILGLGLSLAPIGAYIAVTGIFYIIPILFSLTVLFWVSGFDIIYSLQDEEFDKANRLHSIPAAVGKKIALRISELLHLLSATCIALAGYYGGFGVIYWLGAAVFIGMLIYQHTIVKPHDLSRVNVAFMTANGIASVVFAIFVIADLFIYG